MKLDFDKIIETQRQFDETHGFPVKFANNKDKYLQISKDLVGLFGEVGEFANIVKKINLEIDKGRGCRATVSELESGLPEELIDSLIYLIRIASILDIDILGSYFEKLGRNADKYRGFENG